MSQSIVATPPQKTAACHKFDGGECLSKYTTPTTKSDSVRLNKMGDQILKSDGRGGRYK